ncbi:NAD(P)-binding protein [Saitoella complicata NRRL Y-17804]|uniref:D-xylose 1-dehydrogenase (NADP(+), D-xylono-1,5-lactone-forming) n=1 Tax=Saitoella complicata (strain BCRC 22490 / CBS 7301 / JCM 7358 / NBRC 10748 / NRRL Y-17804) TaxID=698492 RepID=A0A0E9ND30_SAICN|nr:NAD(P)-binding protein [Saitoella complicata NRRL Y-17804]ODQ56262.1 NAD(P)-binding protein [Saitoella complicata NRRL Y-17804]GAO47762.1 hypothetical protein G7K_1961-t1 [Saitoella complicata NRRL Y-17804]
MAQTINHTFNSLLNRIISNPNAEAPKIHNALRIGILCDESFDPEHIIIPARTKSDLKITAIATPDPALTQRLGKTHSIPRTYDTYAHLIRSLHIDAVYIALPFPQRHAIILQCIRKEMPVLCEGPISVSGEEAQEIYSRAAEKQLEEGGKGVLILEDLWVLAHPATHRARELVQKAGTPVRATIKWTATDGIDATSMTHQCLSLLRFLIGSEVADVTTSEVRRNAADGTLADAVTAELRFINGCIATLEVDTRVAPTSPVGFLGGLGLGKKEDAPTIEIDCEHQKVTYYNFTTPNIFNTLSLTPLPPITDHVYSGTPWPSYPTESAWTPHRFVLEGFCLGVKGRSSGASPWWVRREFSESGVDVLGLVFGRGGMVLGGGMGGAEATFSIE